jgi:hypothetical protein
MKTLLEDPESRPGEAYDRLARMPPRVFVELPDQAMSSKGPWAGNKDWDGWMADITAVEMLKL